MPADLILEIPLVVAGIAGWWSFRGGRERHRKQRLTVLSGIAQQVLEQDIGKNWHPTYNTPGRLPLGADASAAAALRAIQRYQDQRALQQSRGLVLPSCYVGAFKVGGCGDEAAGNTDAETVVCEELKAWLLGAAAGAEPARTVEQRLEFCHQILMRPETFSETPFLAVMATVCERLDELLARLAGAVRSCALQLSKLLNSGREIINVLLPVLILAITDSVADGPLPTLSAEMLAASAINMEGTRQSTRDIFASMWQTDAGNLLRELLRSPHFKQFWGFDETDLSPSAGTGVNGMKVEFWHEWEDGLLRDESLPGSGLHELFQNQRYLPIIQSYLNLFDNIDRFAKFMSMMEHYKLLANIGGDAGMYHLRASLHHLLKELELVLLPMEQGTAEIMENVKRVVREIALTDSQPTGRRLLWIERLQDIDECLQVGIFRNFRHIMSELRYLSCDARLPALQSACEQSLNQITAIMDSPEFRGRCTVEPPALASPTFEAIADKPASPEEGDDVGIVVTSDELWSLQQQFRVEHDEAPTNLETQSRKCSPPEVGDIVADLNNGKIPDPGVCYVLQCHRKNEYMILHKADKRESALDMLGLGKSERCRSVKRILTRCSTELSAHEEGQASEEQAVNGQEDERTEKRDTLQATHKVVDATEATDDALSPEMQATFYEVLFAAVLPLFEQSEHLTADQLRMLLERSNLDSNLLERILATEKDALKHNLVDCQTLKRLGCLVAHGQHKLTDVAAAQKRTPSNVPDLRGILWDKRRPKKVGIIEPF
mmetsp:Transcript_88835/g.176631  ORF Transcript_88835/g.176631 Transcript_88835/m.176631 type:complete len:776 (+) Transcript_88835:63-2390(+)